MKRIIMTAALLVLLCGCGTKEAAPAGTPLSDQIAPPKTEQNIQVVRAEDRDAQPEEPVQPETPAVPEEPETPDLPDVDPTSWELILANSSHSIEEYAPPLAQVEGMDVDERIVGPLTDFIAAARAEGLSVYLSSAYRDYNNQAYLFNRKVEQYGNEEEAAAIVARPGTSEHQTGLACDITDQYYELKNSSLEDTALYRWMSKHCQDYGFIVRYPKDNEDVTGIIYEPWHFRYVGKEAAGYIMEHGLCLEEFLDLYK